MTKEELDARIEELRGRKTMVEAMLEHRGYQELREVLLAQIRVRRTEAFSTMIDGLDAAFKQATRQAEVGAIQFCLDMPRLLIQDMDADVEALLIELEGLEDVSD